MRVALNPQGFDPTFPRMVKVASEETTVGQTGHHAIARCQIMRNDALSNLSYAMFLAATQSSGGGTSVAAKPKEDEPKTAAEKLSRKKTSATL